ncbi:YlbG family protein [Paenibacillus aurantiacus]|uniref:YlbG family protein n=1 Tax=Paenibacillus aurantiacus TaxID=1936118 RepID=A0ABV5L2S0_9BACL
MQFSERVGYIVWVSDLKAARTLEKYGSVHYMSRKMHYVVMYMNADRAEETVRNMQRLSFVRRIERSYRNEIKTEYTQGVPDKTRFYSL